LWSILDASGAVAAGLGVEKKREADNSNRINDRKRDINDLAVDERIDGSKWW